MSYFLLSVIVFLVVVGRFLILREDPTAVSDIDYVRLIIIFTAFGNLMGSSITIALFNYKAKASNVSKKLVLFK